MIWPWGVIGYVAIALLLWRIFAGYLAWDGYNPEVPESKPLWSAGFWLGLIGGVVWPLTCLLCVANWIDKHDIRIPTPYRSKAEREGIKRREAYRHKKRLKEVGMDP